MSAFLMPWAASLVATVLIATGIGHLAALRRFRGLIADHGLVPRRLAAGAAAAVTVCEIAGGVAAAALLTGKVPPLPVFTGAVVLGGVFLLYLQRLLHEPGTVRACGCTPWRSPLTPAARLPAAALVAAGLAGAVATAAGEAVVAAGPWHSNLAAAWGVTTAGIVLLYPAVLPSPAAEAAK